LPFGYRHDRFACTRSGFLVDCRVFRSGRFVAVVRVEIEATGCHPALDCFAEPAIAVNAKGPQHVVARRRVPTRGYALVKRRTE
jgi:hypothetical protein